MYEGPRKWVIHDIPLIPNKINTQSFYPTILRKGWWGVGSAGKVFSTPMLKLPQNWVICIGENVH